MLDRTVFDQGFALLCERFGRDLSPELRELYYEGLSGLTDAVFTAGVRRVIHDAEFFPPIGALKPPPDPAGGEQAWGALVFKQDCRATFAHEQGFDLEAAKSAGQSTAPPGGWGMMPLVDEQWYRKRFLEAYAHFAESRRHFERDQLPPWTDDGRRLLRDAMAGKPVPELAGGASRPREANDG